MRDLLKMPIIWRGAQGDDEAYVRLMRRLLAAGKAVGFVNLVIGLLCLALSLGLPYWLFHALATAQSAVGVSSVHPAVACGFIFGSVTGAVALMGVLELGLGLRLLIGLRSERLLVKYFDECQRLRMDRTADNAATPDQ